jgi:invasion protein IalB
MAGSLFIPCTRKDLLVFKVTNYFGAILCLLLSHTALHAQTGQLPAAEEFSTGEVLDSTPAIGDYYIKGTYGDWTLRCLKAEQSPDPCQLFQLMYSPDGAPVAEYNLNPIESDGVVVAGANVITPLETLLTQQLTIQIDDQNAKIYPFAFCVQMGCVARIGLTQEDFDIYCSGAQAIVTIFPAAAPTQPERLVLSLKGFTAGHVALMESLEN